ncbi:MAG: tetraether lipid synthase Tes [Candidatus Baldrarchaeia archaeon]
MEREPPRIPPYETKSICPECILDGKVNVITAKVYEENGKIMIEKTCPQHGTFKDVYWGSAEQFKRVMKWWYKGLGLENPRTQTQKGCPQDCGLCPNHKTHTALALIDVTNRCNLRCPICFANAASAGYVYEPSKEEIRKILINFRNNRPVPAPAVQFAGGEPTVREDLPELIKMAKEVGFPHVEIATNGLRLMDEEYARKLKEAGLSTIYLQFDGVTPKPYEIARGRNLLPEKLKIIEVCRKVGLHSIVLVPTLVRGVNDDQVGKIIEFAVKNFDVIRAVNFQPVSITGRINREEREKMRITIPDLMKLAEEQTNGRIKENDWYPTSFPIPLARALGLIKGKPAVEFSTHPACGMATFIVVEENGEYAPITKYIDVERFIGTMEKIADDLEKGGRIDKLKSRVRLLGAVRYVKKKGLLKDLIATILKRGDYSSLGEFMRRIIMIGSMHFQDPYNFDLERVERCCIHYGLPDGRIVPFCSMNSIHRPVIERQFAVSIEEWKRQKGKLTEIEAASIAMS